MRALKIAGAAIAAVIVVIALLLVIGIPSSFLTSTIEERVERETGLKLAINGGAKIGLWPSLNVTLNDIALKDPKDRDINNRLTASRIQADVTLASVWAGRPRDHRTTDRATGCHSTAAARARSQSARQDGLLQCCRRHLDRACQRHRRHGGDVQSARPRREPHRDHQCRRHRSAATASSRSRAMRARRRAAEIRDQGEPRRAPPIERQSIPAELTIRCARPAAGTADRARPKCGSTARL